MNVSLLKNNIPISSKDEDVFLSRLIQEYNNSTITKIGDQAFANCSALTSITFPKVTTIGELAFLECTALSSINFPEVITIDRAAFDRCASLTSINFPKLNKTVG